MATSSSVAVSAGRTMTPPVSSKRWPPCVQPACRRACWSIRATATAAKTIAYTPALEEASSVIFEQGQKVLFIGDSITDCGRREGPHAPYGNGYVALARTFLLARYAELGLEVVNRGIGGNTVRDLAARWQDDVIAEQPDWLSVKIGINDVWRAIANRLDEAV